MNNSLPSLSKVLDQRAGLVTCVFVHAAIWLVNICEHRAEASDRCRDSAIGTRYEERRFGNVAPDRSEQPRRAEGPEDFAVGGITKEHGQPALGSARRRSLRKAQSGCGELAAAGVQEHVERSYRGCRIQDVGVATVPVDLAATVLERPWVIEVVGSPRAARNASTEL